MNKLYVTILLFSLISPAHAGSEDTGESYIIEQIALKSTGFAEQALSSFFTGRGLTEINIKTMQNKKPEVSIMLVRPLIMSPMDAFFSQVQFNHYYVTTETRFALNLGLGYRKLSADKNYLLGMNVFLDMDEEDNARASLGLELKSSAFSAYANFYEGLSGGQKIRANTERVLDGLDVHLLGQVPYLPWADIHYKYFEWDAEKNARSTYGHTLSLEMLLHPSIILEVGYEDNNFTAAEEFASLRYVYPPIEGAAATDVFVSDIAFEEGDVSDLLLSKVERTNKIMVETESAGMVIGRLD